MLIVNFTPLDTFQAGLTPCWLALTHCLLSPESSFTTETVTTTDPFPPPPSSSPSPIFVATAYLKTDGSHFLCSLSLRKRKQLLHSFSTKMEAKHFKALSSVTAFLTKP